MWGGRGGLETQAHRPLLHQEDITLLRQTSIQLEPAEYYFRCSGTNLRHSSTASCGWEPPPRQQNTNRQTSLSFRQCCRWRTDEFETDIVRENNSFYAWVYRVRHGSLSHLVAKGGMMAATRQPDRNGLLACSRLRITLVEHYHGNMPPTTKHAVPCLFGHSGNHHRFQPTPGRRRTPMSAVALYDTMEPSFSSLSTDVCWSVPLTEPLHKVRLEPR